MIDDLIRRKDAIEAFEKVDLVCGLDGKGNPVKQEDLLCQITGTLLKIPAEQRTGKWDKDGKCNQCGEESGFNAYGFRVFSQYCPHCGARMVRNNNGC